MRRSGRHKGCLYTNEEEGENIRKKGNLRLIAEENVSEKEQNDEHRKDNEQRKEEQRKQRTTKKKEQLKDEEQKNKRVVILVQMDPLERETHQDNKIWKMRDILYNSLKPH